MDIKRDGSQPSSKGPAEWFTGSVRVNPLFEAPVPARARGASVTFEPGARTAWHTHPLGQTLIVTSGCGRVQRYAVNQLGENFGIRTLLLEGGGHINGAFLEADLVDEVSLLVVPGIDGRHDIPAVFDGVSPSRKTAVPLRLKSVEQRGHDALWIRYEVIRSERVERRNNAKA
jgi:riboflavin biosynthesis pyrimidine reductase